MKQKGPSKQSSRGGNRSVGQANRGAVRGGKDSAQRGGDRSLIGRKYETGAALRGADQGVAGTQDRGQVNELDRVAGELHEQHGERIAAGSQKVGVPAESTAAVVLTETSQLRGVSDDRVPVRFEPYEFFRRTGQWLVATHRDQDAEYQVFAQAKGIDGQAAHESLRMGVAQLSGQEAVAAGYENATEMFAGMQQGPAAQIDGLVSVVGAESDLQTAMAESDWRAVAELRAGPGYGALGYDDALAAYADAYKRATTSYGGGDDNNDDDDKPKRKKGRKSGKKA